jgi:hypothetical protein
LLEITPFIILLAAEDGRALLLDFPGRKKESLFRNFRVWTWSACYWSGEKEEFFCYQLQGSSPSFLQIFGVHTLRQVDSSWNVWQEFCEIIVHGMIETHIIELC